MFKYYIGSRSQFADNVYGVIMLNEQTSFQVKAEALNFIMGGDAFGESRFEPAGFDLFPVNILTHE